MVLRIKYIEKKKPIITESISYGLGVSRRCVFRDMTEPTCSKCLILHEVGIPAAGGGQYNELGTCGGITEVKKVCEIAYVHDIGVQIHTCVS